MKDKNIVLIGPVYPYKGGISHYTGLLYRTLAKNNKVTMVSYKMQYPKLLFKKEQRDYSNDAFKIEDTKFWIHTANPFNLVGVAGKINRIKPDLVIIQWWHPYFAPCYTILAKLIKAPILFTCHNVFPHERFPMDTFLTKCVLKKGSYFIVQSEEDEKGLLSIRSDFKYARTVHPTYNAFKMKDMTKQEARAQLGISEDERVLLFFGFVREYKGLKHLLNAMPKLKDTYGSPKQDAGSVTHMTPDTGGEKTKANKATSGIKLLVVGDFAGDKEVYLEQMNSLGITDFVEIHDGYIPDGEVQKFFEASDIVVLPYESATQSGIVQISYGFEKTVVVTNVGGLPEVVTDGKTGYVVPPQNPEAIADAIIDFYENHREAEFKAGIQAEAARFSWEHMEEVIEGLISGS